MKTFVLKLRTNGDLENGIAVVSKSDDTVVLREYHKKDEILRTYKDGVAFSWFIISVDKDEVIYINNKKWERYRCVSEDVKDTVYLNVTPELFWVAKENDIELPESYKDAFKTALEELFKFPVFQSEKRKWSTATVFNQYRIILFKLDKTVNDFIEQKIIDDFFEKLISIYALSTIKMLLDGECVKVSPNIEALMSILKSELRAIGSKAFSTLIEEGIRDWVTEYWTAMKYGSITFKLRVKNYRVYVVIPYGKSEVWECVGWLFD